MGETASRFSQDRCLKSKKILVTSEKQAAWSTWSQWEIYKNITLEIDIHGL